MSYENNDAYLYDFYPSRTTAVEPGAGYPVKFLLRLASYGSLGALLALVIGLILVLERRQDLEVWHLADLDEEFTARSSIASFTEYLELEQRKYRTY